MAKRILERAPIHTQVVNENMTSQEWARWFGLIAEHAFRRDKYAVTINPSSVSANSTSEQAFTVDGVEVGDVVIVQKPTHTSGLGIGNVRVSNTDEISITFMNITGSPIDPPSEAYIIFIMKV